MYGAVPTKENTKSYLERVFVLAVLFIKKDNQKIKIELP